MISFCTNSALLAFVFSHVQRCRDSTVKRPCCARSWSEEKHFVKTSSTNLRVHVVTSRTKSGAYTSAMHSSVKSTTPWNVPFAVVIIYFAILVSFCLHDVHVFDLFSLEKVQELTAQVESLCDELDDVKRKSNDESRKLKQDLNQRVSVS